MEKENEKQVEGPQRLPVGSISGMMGAVSTPTLQPFVVLPLAILLYSLFQSSWAGIVYAVLLFLSVMLRNMFNHSDATKSECYQTFGSKTILNLSLFVSFFTLWYIALPMIVYATPNAFILVVIVVITLLVLFSSRNCIRTEGSYDGWRYFLVDLILSIVFASGAVLILMAIVSPTKNAGLYLFMSPGGNREVCSKPTKQRFICKTYKNGELVKSS